MSPAILHVILNYPNTYPSFQTSLAHKLRLFTLKSPRLCLGTRHSLQMAPLSKKLHMYSCPTLWLIRGIGCIHLVEGSAILSSPERRLQLQHGMVRRVIFALGISILTHAVFSEIVRLAEESPNSLRTKQIQQWIVRVTDLMSLLSKYGDIEAATLLKEQRERIKEILSCLGTRPETKTSSAYTSSRFSILTNAQYLRTTESP